jgi:DNA repair protein RadC
MRIYDGRGRGKRRKLAVRERAAAGEIDVMSDEELVALLLNTGAPGVDALTSAGELLDRLGGLGGLERASLRALQDQPGVGLAKATRVMAALELGRRCLGRDLRPGTRIRGSTDVVARYRSRLAHLDRERFEVLLLDTRHRVIREHCVSIGCLDSTIVHPREVFHPAVAESAAAVIVVHNHPSGDPAPSGEDQAVTRRLQSTADVLGIELLDHIIVARDGSYSFRDAGQM